MDRSTLYNIEPIGIGTPFVESLTSYIIRLSEAHCVLTGSLISKVYTPLLGKEYLSKISSRGGDGFYDSAIGINGLGKLAGEFIELTEKFTGRTDLGFTTLKAFSQIFPNRGLLKKTKSWCPICYEEDRVKGRIIYDQLIWNFQLVGTCLKHKSPLKNICVHCGQFVSVINRKSVPGTCSKCGQWLGTINSLTYPESYKDESLKNVSLIGELLAEKKNTFSIASPKESINFYVSSIFDGSVTEAARCLKVPKSTFTLWMTGKSNPSIKYLLQVSKMLGISLIEFLEMNKDIKLIHSAEEVFNHRERYDHFEIRNILHKAIIEKEPVSISELARRIGCDRKLLSKKYKDECEQIKANYSYYVQKNRQQNEELKLLKLEQAVKSLSSHAIYPSRRQVESILGNGFLKEKAVQEKWNNLKRSYQI
ncbi:helix-turn-helix domain-containing protein [Halalkalibacter akibai]|uniref:Zinc finger protein n=1 Tax=Halalkalibacter akibai (strain ATCC 43226 / DSM 21942 / CIP 109018 / JCM 9157 / 1139) TaxID=1236973 RepID=W4QNB2_HALA3|nr:helix-turn-helix domain-containing protein [Halalkalibacter akibai]GAE33148.1 zinc finger protein [Halalkalibacter akibai JCM 9157]